MRAELHTYSITRVITYEKKKERAEITQLQLETEECWIGYIALRRLLCISTKMP